MEVPDSTAGCVQRPTIPVVWSPLRQANPGPAATISPALPEAASKTIPPEAGNEARDNPCSLHQPTDLSTLSLDGRRATRKRAGRDMGLQHCEHRPSRQLSAVAVSGRRIRLSVISARHEPGRHGFLGIAGLLANHVARLSASRRRQLRRKLVHPHSVVPKPYPISSKYHPRDSAKARPPRSAHPLRPFDDLRHSVPDPLLRLIAGASQAPADVRARATAIRCHLRHCAVLLNYIAGRDVAVTFVGTDLTPSQTVALDSPQNSSRLLWRPCRALRWRCRRRSPSGRARRSTLQLFAVAACAPSVPREHSSTQVVRNPGTRRGSSLFGCLIGRGAAPPRSSRKCRLSQNSVVDQSLQSPLHDHLTRA